MSTAGDQGRVARGSLTMRVKASSKTRMEARGSKWVRDMMFELLIGLMLWEALASSTCNHKICMYACQVFLSVTLFGLIRRLQDPEERTQILELSLFLLNIWEAGHEAIEAGDEAIIDRRVW